MNRRHTILYIHGMGGGGDSRIPSILREYFSCHSLHGEMGQESDVEIICRTYDFDPEVAQAQIRAWVDELHPELIIGESLGALHAMRIKGVSHLFVSPALNAPVFFGILSWLSLLPGVTWYFDRKYRPKDGDRQPLHFCRRILRKYKAHRAAAFTAAKDRRPDEMFHAFFGTHDHYRRSGIVSVKSWEKHFGKSYTMYDGTHFMENELISSLLVPAVINLLTNK